MDRSLACRGPRNFCCRCRNSRIMRKSASSMSRPTAAAFLAPSRCCFEPATGSRCRFRSALRRLRSARSPPSSRTVCCSASDPLPPTSIMRCRYRFTVRAGPSGRSARRRCCQARLRPCHSGSNRRDRSHRHRRRRFFPDAVRSGDAGRGSHFDGDHAFDGRRRPVAGPLGAPRRRHDCRYCFR